MSITTWFVKIMSMLSSAKIEQKEIPDLRGFRLHWFRLQAYTSVAKAQLNLKENENFAKFMNTFYFHSQLIDDHFTLLGTNIFDLILILPNRKFKVSFELKNFLSS